MATKPPHKPCSLYLVKKRKPSCFVPTVIHTGLFLYTKLSRPRVNSHLVPFHVFLLWNPCSLGRRYEIYFMTLNSPVLCSRFRLGAFKLCAHCIQKQGQNGVWRGTDVSLSFTTVCVLCTNDAWNKEGCLFAITVFYSTYTTEMSQKWHFLLNNSRTLYFFFFYQFIITINLTFIAKSLISSYYLHCRKF